MPKPWRMKDALAKATGDRVMDRYGISDAMWDELVSVYQARHARERGKLASYDHRTLNALYRRGLVTMAVGQDAEGRRVGLWSTSDKGASLVKRGRE